ncbi:MAG: hypothetical protein QOD60_666 [Solirubrobacterales bacterium]|jgi:hypothetical protein|nr:hypothetical protein [Solirubrobacterales bacterium]
MRRTAAATVLLCCCLALAACGSRRGEPPKLDVTAPPAKAAAYTSPSGDVSFSYPENWAVQPRAAPGVVTVSTGGASATIWAYRSVSLVADPKAAQQALQRFLASLKTRDPNFVVSSTAVTTVFQRPAFEVQGTTVIQGRPTEARSVHAFIGVGEYVLDMLADPDKFDEINRTVFSPMLVSWHFLGNPPSPDQAAGGSSSPTAPASP